MNSNFEMVDLNSINSFIFQQVIKKRSQNKEGTMQDRKKQREHFSNLVQSVKKDSNGQASVLFDDNNFSEFKVNIQPNDGPYKDGTFSFNFNLRSTYPSTAPKIVCTTHVYHPNIDDEGDICLSIINEWSSNENDLIDCIQGLLFILYNPNLDDPLSPYFAPGEDIKVFHDNVKLSMKGGEVNGVYFDNVLDS